MSLPHDRFRRAAVWTSRAAVPLLLSSSVVSVIAMHAPDAAASAETECSPGVTGAPFSYNAIGGHHLSGKSYKVMVINESCVTARTVVAKLTHAALGTHTVDGGFAITGGPSGWKCEGKGESSTTHAAPAISGDCYLGTLLDPTKFLYWETAVN
jgi:hypothetical protein